MFVCFAGSVEEREVYKKAKRRATLQPNESVEPAQLSLTIRHPNPVFGTDFDVIVEVHSDRILFVFFFCNVLVWLCKSHVSNTRPLK